MEHQPDQEPHDVVHQYVVIGMTVVEHDAHHSAWLRNSRQLPASRLHAWYVVQYTDAEHQIEFLVREGQRGRVPVHPTTLEIRRIEHPPAELEASKAVVDSAIIDAVLDEPAGVHSDPASHFEDLLAATRVQELQPVLVDPFLPAVVDRLDGLGTANDLTRLVHRDRMGIPVALYLRGGGGSALRFEIPYDRRPSRIGPHGSPLIRAKRPPCARPSLV